MPDSGKPKNNSEVERSASADSKSAALRYHRFPTPGKISVTPSKPLANQRDLALAYSPGVAAACEAIIEDQAEAANVTSRANLVAVITNGTAVLGLGAIGPLASKPVMEGKAVLFKKFAGVDVFDIEIAEQDPLKLVEIIAALEPTFGAINLEDIKAPDCFIIESALRERMNIPVFHDDQHGTAIVVAAAVVNGLKLLNKDIAKVRVCSTGGGAAGIACLNQLVALGLNRDNVILCDHKGVVFKGRAEDMTDQKAEYASDTKARSLTEAVRGADIFLGLSAPGILTQDMIKTMAKAPFIMALANPTPEILPELAKDAVNDAIIATGRSDYPNQVNNVLCFPYIFRGALDVGATTINEEMKAACVEAIAELARGATSAVVSAAYGGEEMRFGPEYLIPKPFDPRLICEIAPAVAKAAMDTGVATRPIDDLTAYADRLQQQVYRSTFVMKPIFEKARANPKRVAFAEGEDRRVLFAVQALLEEGIATPVLVGRPLVISHRARKLGLQIKPGEDFEVVNPEEDDRYIDYWRHYHSLMERKGVTPETAKTAIRTNTTAIAALMVARGDADAMICGTSGEYQWHLQYLTDLLGLADSEHKTSALSLLVMDSGPVFITDTFVSENPSADDIAYLTRCASRKVGDFGLTPKVALIAASNFGAGNSRTAIKMREALQILRRDAPELETEGEMQPDVALDAELRSRVFPNSRLKGAANLLVMPNLEAANAGLKLVRGLAGALHVGPILLGIAKPAHITTSSVTARGLVNLAALAVIDAQVMATDPSDGVS
ncbi:MAG: NADP-dependent malic enzyme [Candidatus Marinimicrobia bacterium]|nr:NADP-dependent malic enzyme [Candidatus Neomarinimicrobiota bacterium]